MLYGRRRCEVGRRDDLMLKRQEQVDVSDKMDVRMWLMFMGEKWMDGGTKHQGTSHIQTKTSLLVNVAFTYAQSSHTYLLRTFLLYNTKQHSLYNYMMEHHDHMGHGGMDMPSDGAKCSMNVRPDTQSYPLLIWTNPRTPSRCCSPGTPPTSVSSSPNGASPPLSRSSSPSSASSSSPQVTNSSER